MSKQDLFVINVVYSSWPYPDVAGGDHGDSQDVMVKC